MKKTFENFNGRILFSERVKKGLTREELAELLGVSVTSVCNWENNKTNPKVVNVRELDSLFSVKDDHWTQFSESIKELPHDQLCKKVEDLQKNIDKIEAVYEERLATLTQHVLELEDKIASGVDETTLNVNINSNIIDIFKKALIASETPHYRMAVTTPAKIRKEAVNELV